MQHVTDEEEVRERKYQNKLAIFFFSLLIILLGLLAFTQEIKAEVLSIGNSTTNSTFNFDESNVAITQSFIPTQENFTGIELYLENIGTGSVNILPCPVEQTLSWCEANSGYIHSWDLSLSYQREDLGDNKWLFPATSGTWTTASSTSLLWNSEFDQRYFIHVINTGESSNTKYNNTNVSLGEMWTCTSSSITTCSIQNNSDLYFGIYVEGNDLSITAPTNNQIYTLTDINAATKDIVVSGTCPHNGEDQLLITNNLYCRYSYAEDYNIDCIDYEYTATTTMQFLGNGYPYQIMVMDRAFSLAGQILTGACVVGTDEYGQPEDWAGRQHVDISLFQDLEYNLQITSPTSTNEFIFEVQPSQNFPFNFTYNIQQDYIGDEFVLVEMADDNYSSSTRTIMGGYLSDLDRMRTGNLWSQENLLDYTEPGIIAENNVVKYYTVLIANASSTPTTLSRINFSVEGNTESLIFDTNQSGVGTWCSDPEAWDDNIFTEALKKSFCWLFVGNAKNKALDLKNTSELLFANKIPFAYWNKFQEEWNSPRTTGNKKIIFNLDAFDAFDNESPLNNFQIEIFDFENPGWTEAHWKVFNFLEDIVIPIMASIWVFMMAFNFFYRLSR